MAIYLSFIAWFCWVIVYVEMIRIGLKEKTYGMPIFVLALNLVWEVLYSVLSIKIDFKNPQGWLILVWFLLDILIFYTYLLYGKKHFPKSINQKYFKSWIMIILLMAFVVQISFLIEFGRAAIFYSAFIQNLIMSIAFINMLYIRKNASGQNLIIAFMKWIGTLLPTIVYGVIYSNQLCLILGILCSIFDIIYIYYLTITIKDIKLYY